MGNVIVKFDTGARCVVLCRLKADSTPLITPRAQLRPLVGSAYHTKPIN